jgi:OOP family OmpA-OmpF porin
MQSKLILLGTVAALSLAAASNTSAHNQGWYIGLEGGGTWVSDEEGFFGINSAPAVLPETIEFDTGWAVLATVGYAFESNWRVEFEAGYRQNDIESIAIFPFPAPFTGDEINEITLMANVLYDIPLTDRLSLALGLGAGVDRAEFSPGPFWGGDDDDWNFAFQAIAGLNYAITNRLDLTLTYRYLNVGDPEFNVPGGPNPTPDHWDLDDLEKHTVTVGLRYDLYEDEAPMAPASPPPPPPPPEPEAKQFIVFFGFNKSNLTPEALDVIREAAAAAKSQGSASILVVGHTDTVGSNKYNDALALRRSGAVKKGLIAEGIDGGSISASGRGENELLVKTGDNVKEPQNRRATIDLQ